MSFLIPLSEDENYEILDRDPSLKQLRKFVGKVHEAQEKDEVPERGEVSGNEDAPFSTIPEDYGEQFYTINYIAKLMEVDPSEVSRCRKALVNSGDFLSTNIFESTYSNPNYFRITDEKVAECIQKAIEGYFFDLADKEKEAIQEIVSRTNISQFKIFYETSASQKNKYVKGEKRKVNYGLVENFYLAMELKDWDIEGYESLQNKFSEYENRTF